jgi:hypothetical protein
MHPSFLAISALDLWHERVLEAERRARLMDRAGPFPRTITRRTLGRVAAWVSRTTGALALRLDDRVTLRT